MVTCGGILQIGVIPVVNPNFWATSTITTVLNFPEIAAMFQRVDFVNGDFELVTLPMAQYSRVSALRDQMRRLISPGMGWQPEMDALLYPRLTGHYQKIAARLTPSIDPNRLTLVSRFRFFICSEPLDLVPGLSQLDQLLGYTYASTEPDPSKPEKAVITSGNPIVDLTAELLLSLKGDAKWLMECYSVDFISKMLTQIAQRQNPEILEQLQQQKDREFLERTNVTEALREHYKRQGIPLPDDF